MTELQRSALVVGVDAAAFQGLAARLRRVGFISDWVASGGEAQDLLSLLPFDAVIAVYPVADITTKQFLSVMRRAEAPCRNAAVVLLAPEAFLGDAMEFIGLGANAVLPLAEAVELLPAKLRELIDAAPRYPLRVMSRIRGKVGLSGATTLCQTENISITGMLLRGDQHVPVGGEVHFELTLPGEGKSLRGTGQVVRHTFEKRERVSGLGIKFTSFEGDGQVRLQTYLASLR